MKIDELKIKYLNYLMGRGRTEGTKKAYDFDLSKFIDHLNVKDMGNVEDITTTIIEDYLFGLDVSSATKERRRVTIKKFFDYLSRRGEIKNNPANGLESIKVTQKRPEYLSQEQRDVFLETIKQQATLYYKERDLMLVKLLLDTGLRRSEVTGLNISDVDLSKQRLRVKRKGNREEYVIIHPELAKDLNKYLRLISREGGQPLFLSKKGQRLSSSSIWHLVKEYSRKAGFNGNVTVHSLRHTFGTTLMNQGLSLPYIQALMGHKSLQTTTRYLHLQNNELTEAFNKITFERG